jgi:aryl-alcohol dehydrogenase-like predicted oxidoreductase
VTHLAYTLAVFYPFCCLAALKQQLLEQGAASSADIMAGSHCLSRACIRASVAASLAALRLETLDLLYLHNAAEVQLLARGKAGFMEVLKAAFQELEALRQEVGVQLLW